MSEVVTGTVKFFNETKGFGFITQDKRTRCFLSIFLLLILMASKHLLKAKRLEFQVADGKKGPEAQNVTPL